MTGHTHITAGRTAFRLLLVVALLTTTVVGATGTVAASLDGKGNDPYPTGQFASVDQDMEPYSVDTGVLFQDMEPYSVDQDMEPY